MGANGTPNKVRSSRMAWLRKRISTMEPEQVAHTAEPTWTASQPHGCPLYRNRWDQTTLITMSTGPHCPGTKKSLSFLLDSIYLNCSYREPPARKLPIFFSKQVLGRCQATTAKRSLYLGFCSQLRNLTFCGMPSTTGRFPLRKASVNHQAIRGHEDYDLTNRSGLTVRGRQCTALLQSLPGRDSRDERTVPSPKIQERSLVDAQVGGLVGQQPPEAKSQRFLGSLFKANQHDQLLQFGSPQGTRHA